MSTEELAQRLESIAAKYRRTATYHSNPEMIKKCEADAESADQAAAKLLELEEGEYGKAVGRMLKAEHAADCWADKVAELEAEIQHRKYPHDDWWVKQYDKTADLLIKSEAERDTLRAENEELLKRINLIYAEFEAESSRLQASLGNPNWCDLWIQEQNKLKVENQRLREENEHLINAGERDEKEIFKLRAALEKAVQVAAGQKSFGLICERSPGVFRRLKQCHDIARDALGGEQ